jgi:MFS family permease
MTVTDRSNVDGNVSSPAALPEPALSKLALSQDMRWPSPARAWWMMVVFFAAAMLSYTDRFIFSLLVDPVRAELHISDTQVSLLQGLAFVLIYAFAGVPLGRVADTLPRRSVIIGGVVLWSAATLACGFSRTFAELFVARVAVGVGEAALAPAAVSMIADCFPPERRGTAIGVFIAGMAIGGGAAIAIGGTLLDAANLGMLRDVPMFGALAPWRAVLVMLGVPGIVLVALLLTVREPERRRDRSGKEPAHRLTLRDVALVFRARGHVLLPLYLGVALVSAGDMSFQNWTPALLSRRFALSAGQIGSHLGALSIATGVLGTLAGGVLSDLRANKGGEPARLSIAVGAVLVGLVGAAIALAPTANQTLACFAVWTLMASAAEAVAITTLQAVIPNEVRGIGVALISLGNMLIGLGGGTALTALLTDHVFHDPRAVGLSMGCVALPAGLAAIALFWVAQAGQRKMYPT